MEVNTKFQNPTPDCFAQGDYVAAEDAPFEHFQPRQRLRGDAAGGFGAGVAGPRAAPQPLAPARQHHAAQEQVTQAAAAAAAAAGQQLRLRVRGQRRGLQEPRQQTYGA